MAIDFATRCQQILQLAMQWAPHTTQSHLQEFVASLSSHGEATGEVRHDDDPGMTELRRHAGLALTIETILQYAAEHSTALTKSSASTAAATGASSSPTSVSTKAAVMSPSHTNMSALYVSSLTMRSFYLGELGRSHCDPDDQAR